MLFRSCYVEGVNITVAGEKLQKLAVCVNIYIIFADLSGFLKR